MKNLQELRQNELHKNYNKKEFVKFKDEDIKNITEILKKDISILIENEIKDIYFNEHDLQFLAFCGVLNLGFEFSTKDSNLIFSQCELEKEKVDILRKYLNENKCLFKYLKPLKH